jgi:hypothetical protein
VETPAYIKQLLKPNGKSGGRRVWSIDLETVWLPFFTATNAIGDTAIPSEALGAPLRLQYNPDGTVKFSKTGRPVIRVVKEISDSVRLVRENFTATLVNYANSVAMESPEAYQSQLDRARKAGEPIVNRDRANLDKAIRAEAERAKAEAKAQAEAKPHKEKVTA